MTRNGIITGAVATAGVLMLAYHPIDYPAEATTPTTAQFSCGVEDVLEVIVRDDHEGYQLAAGDLVCVHIDNITEPTP